MQQATIKATIYLENRFWVGSFERTDLEGYAIAKRVFGKEPTDAEIYSFVLNHYHELEFGPQKEFNPGVLLISLHR